MSPWNAVGFRSFVFCTIIGNAYLYIPSAANFDIECMSIFVDRIEFIIPAFYCVMNLLDVFYLLGAWDSICSCSTCSLL
jgi:hypothetical protein